VGGGYDLETFMMRISGEGRMLAVDVQNEVPHRARKRYSHHERDGGGVLGEWHLGHVHPGTS
jgi:hypothetical protein